MLKSNLRSKTLKSFTWRPKIRNQNFKIDPPGYLPVARHALERGKCPVGPEHFAGCRNASGLAEVRGVGGMLQTAQLVYILEKSYWKLFLVGWLRLAKAPSGAFARLKKGF